MKRIIVPVDFSETAANAALYAANVASFYHADLWLFYNYNVMPVLAEYAYSGVNESELESAAIYELEMFKKKIESQLSGPVNISVKAANGDLINALNDFCDEIKPDMVVFGLSGKNALTRLVVGSNTIRAIQQLRYPVLVVPPKAEFLPVRKVGFACDYKKISATTPVYFLKKLVKDFNADLYVMNVEYNQAQQADASGEGAALITSLLEEVKPYYTAVSSPDITLGINWFAEKEKIDWMMMVPRQHSFMEKMFGRSQTKELLYHTHLPVLCMHE